MDQKPFVRVRFFAYSPAESLVYGRCELRDVWLGKQMGWGTIAKIFPIGIFNHEA